jgi:hypothetical protein
MIGLPKFTYEQWCAHSTELLQEATRFNSWRSRAQHRLLLDLAPRIGKLGTQFYTGCGFHYSFEQELGNLIGRLALPVQWSASHCEKIPEERLDMILMQVSVTQLVERIVKAEKSVKA